MKHITDIMRKVGEPIVPELFRSKDARATDPTNAKNAALANPKGRRVGKGSQCGKMLLQFADAIPLAYIGPVGDMTLTAYEAAERAGLFDGRNRPCPWKRANDLVERGLIRKLGTRYDEDTKQDVATFTITDEGRKLTDQWSKDDK